MLKRLFRPRKNPLSTRLTRLFSSAEEDLGINSKMNQILDEKSYIFKSPTLALVFDSPFFNNRSQIVTLDKTKIQLIKSTGRAESLFLTTLTPEPALLYGHVNKPADLLPLGTYCQVDDIYADQMLLKAIHRVSVTEILMGRVPTTPAELAASVFEGLFVHKDVFQELPRRNETSLVDPKAKKDPAQTPLAESERAPSHTLFMTYIRALEAPESQSFSINRQVLTDLILRMNYPIRGNLTNDHLSQLLCYADSETMINNIALFLEQTRFFKPQELIALYLERDPERAIQMCHQLLTRLRSATVRLQKISREVEDNFKKQQNQHYHNEISKAVKRALKKSTGDPLEKAYKAFMAGPAPSPVK